MTASDATLNEAIVKQYVDGSFDLTFRSGRLVRDVFHKHPELRNREDGDPITAAEIMNVGREMGIEWVMDACPLKPETPITECPAEISIDPVRIQLHNELTVETATIALGTVIAIRRGYSTSGPRALKNFNKADHSPIMLRRRSCLWPTRRSAYTYEDRMHFYADCPEVVWFGKIFAMGLLYEQGGLLAMRKFYIGDEQTLIKGIHRAWGQESDLSLAEALDKTGPSLYFLAPETEYQVLHSTEHILSESKKPRDQRIHETIIMFMKAMGD